MSINIKLNISRSLENNFNSNLLTAIGRSEPVCPYCARVLKKMPLAKTKCPFCGNYIFSRTRPIDGLKVLLTEAETEIVEEQWHIINGTHDSYLANKREFDVEKERLSKKFGREAQKNDVLWAIYNKRMLEHSVSGNWGLFRNVRLEMAELLRKEGRLEDSLATYLEIYYIDFNGPKNVGGYHHPQQKPFSPLDAIRAPRILSRILTLTEKTNMTIEKVGKLFQEVNERIFEPYGLIVPPNTAWLRLRSEMNDTFSG